MLILNSSAPDDPTGTELLPDLAMSPPSDLRTEPGEDGGHVLRFTAIMNNLGAADLMVDGARLGDTWTLSQRIPRADSGIEMRGLTADLIWGGDGHDHWHVIDAARFRIETADGPLDTARFDHKVGFCIFDSVPQASGLVGAPDRVVYTIDGCGLQGDDEVAMGLSIGWGDRYRAELPGQWIDLTGMSAGQYRLVAEVDPDGLFAESNRENNEAWTDFALVDTDSGPRVAELRSGADVGPVP